MMFIEWRGHADDDRIEVRQLSDVAVATMVLDDQFALEGREITATFKSLCVFEKVDGCWLWAAGQTMRPSLS